MHLYKDNLLQADFWVKAFCRVWVERYCHCACAETILPLRMRWNDIATAHALKQHSNKVTVMINTSV